MKDSDRLKDLGEKLDKTLQERRGASGPDSQEGSAAGLVDILCARRGRAGRMSRCRRMAESSVAAPGENSYGKWAEVLPAWR